MSAPRETTPLPGLLVLAATCVVAVSSGCTRVEDSLQEPRYVLMVGIDVSGSFRGSDRYDDALRYLAHYIYGHLNGLGDLREPTALFVGSVGGDTPGETKAFHPIHDFRGKDVDQIAADLERWFPAEDRLTDFNAFFRRIGELARRQGLVLAPMNIVLVTDGVPDLMATPDPATEGGEGDVDPYSTIDLSPLEYLSRSITVRILYPEPSVAAGWERKVERRRVRLWTTDAEVMAGWESQLEPGVPLEEQDRLWTWTADNIDFRVRARIF